MIAAKNQIEKTSTHEVILPELTRYQHIRDVDGDDETFTKIKAKLTDDNIKNMELAECLLILNYTHREIKNYIGGNAFLEMIVAYYLKKPIYLLNEIPENMSYTEEIKSLYPRVINSLDFFNE